MADKRPLLPPKEAAAEPPPPPSADVIDTSTGAVRLLQAILASLSLAFDAQQTFISVFTDTFPAWHSTAAVAAAAGPCGLPDHTWSWDHPSHTSIISDWSIQCSSAAIRSLPSSSFFAGCLVGGLLLATLADSLLGRKNLLFLSCISMSVTSALTAASPNIWAYSSLRFLSGIARAAIVTSALVLSTELVENRWRGRISVAGFFFFAIGFLSLPAIAYFCREYSWRSLYLNTSIPAFIYSISLYLLVPESPRWEALQTLNTNPSSANPNSMLQVLSAMKLLFSKKWACKRLVAMMALGFGVGFMYYGMPLNVGNLGFISSDVYMNVAFNALSEIPSSLISFFLIVGMNRRSSTAAFTTGSGVLSVMCVVVRKLGTVRMAMEVVSFFCACTAFNLVQIYSMEMFPTCVRSSAVAMMREALVLGGVAAPVVVAEEGRWAYGVFGVVIGCCGLFVVCLPETRGEGDE